MKEKCRHKSMSRHIKKRKRQYNLYITEGQRGKWDPQGYVIRRTFFFFITIIITRPFGRRGGSFDCLWMVFLSVWVDRRFVTGANCLMPSEASTVMDVTLPPLPIYVVEIRWGQNKKKVVSIRLLLWILYSLHFGGGAKDREMLTEIGLSKLDRRNWSLLIKS